MLEKCCQIYQMLQDEQSRDVYLGRLNWLVTGDFGFLKSVIDKYLPVWNPDEVQRFLSRLPKESPFVLYGMGDGGSILLHYAREDHRFRAIYDRDKNKQKQGFLGYEVKDPDELPKDSGSNIVITTPHFFKEIRSQLVRQGIEEERIFCIDASVFTQGVQREQYLIRTLCRLEKRRYL